MGNKRGKNPKSERTTAITRRFSGFCNCSLAWPLRPVTNHTSLWPITYSFDQSHIPLTNRRASCSHASRSLFLPFFFFFFRFLHSLDRNSALSVLFFLFFFQHVIFFLYIIILISSVAHDTINPQRTHWPPPSSFPFRLPTLPDRHTLWLAELFLPGHAKELPDHAVRQANRGARDDRSSFGQKGYIHGWAMEYRMWDMEAIFRHANNIFHTVVEFKEKVTYDPSIRALALGQQFRHTVFCK